MYAQFFGLKQAPFSIAPDPRYLFMSERHREALAHLLYGVGGGGGFVLLTGEIGAGKTTVCRCFLEQVPRRCNVAYIFNPKLTVGELLKSICDEFGIASPPGAQTVKDFVDPLNDFLLRTHAVGQNNVLIIDEAQNLSADVLEQLRLLTNLETHERKLLQIILIGQPELRAMLARPGLEQLAQRVIARFHLEALSELETAQYIRHRLSVAGMNRPMPFDRAARQRIHKLSRGVPRRINLLCDRALLGAYATGKAKVDRHIVDQAAKEVFEKAEFALPMRSRYGYAVALAAGVAGGAALWGVVAWALNNAAHHPAAAAAPRGDGATRATLPPPAAVAAVLPAHAAAAASAVNLAPADVQMSFGAVERDEKEAWRLLAPAWHLAPTDGDPCQAAQRQQVRCFRSNGGLALIRTLNRPVILTLQDDGGKAFYPLLTGLTGQSATLRMGQAAKTVSLVSLAALWHGEFATFWRAPSGYLDKVAEPGSPLAQWLATQLASLEGAAGPADGNLKSKVYAFQLAQGLKPDGLAGPTTFMQLNRATGVDEPRLQN